MSDIELEDIREKLRCVDCKQYLSYPPILVNAKGDSLCGRCIPKENKMNLVRNNIIETIAEAVTFSCIYVVSGCPVKLNIKEMKYHENECFYRDVNCYFFEENNCRWIGNNVEWRNHCENEHKDKIMTLPYVTNLKQNIGIKKSFLAAKYGFLFFVRFMYEKTHLIFKLCANILGTTEFNNTFSYSVTIEGNDVGTRKRRSVLFFNMKKTQSILIDMNRLSKKMLIDGGYAIRIDINLKKNNCKICNKFFKDNNVTILLDGNYCGKCVNALDDYVEKECIWKEIGCKFKNYAINMPKHEKYLCKYSKMQKYEKGTIIFNEFIRLLKGLDVPNQPHIYSYISYNYLKGLLPGVTYEEFWLPNKSVKILTKFKYTAFDTFEVIILSNIPKSLANHLECKVTFWQEKSAKKVGVLNFDKNSLDYDWKGYISNLDKPYIPIIFIHEGFKRNVLYTLEIKEKISD